MNNSMNNLFKQEYQLKEINNIFQYLLSIYQIKTTIENQFKSLNIQFISMKLHSELIKSIHLSFRNEYIDQINQDISGRYSSRSNRCTTEIPYPWIFLNIDNLIEKLCELSNKLQSLLDSELLDRIKQNETTNEYLLENDYYLMKKLNQTKNTLCNIKLIQDYVSYFNDHV
ncbi:unnamed protein product [Schistosoma curassoni]|uniref:Uncharacterized protein n=1 Tax=Schistosoma curassoni TaxID=6186 RepID=A0A183JNX8_9TREM|nr:unnamed protein product [Schistosoma curassoni]